MTADDEVAQDSIAALGEGLKAATEVLATRAPELVPVMLIALMPAESAHVLVSTVPVIEGTAILRDMLEQHLSALSGRAMRVVAVPEDQHAAGAGAPS